MGTATIACARQLWVTNDSAVLTQLTTLVSVGLPSISNAEVDTTTMADACVQSTRAGLTTLGEIAATFNGILGGADETLLSEWASSKETRACKIVEPDGTSQDVTFNAWPVSLNYGDEVAPGEKVSMTISMKPTALPTIAATA
jgi:hypothetical protein